MGVAKWVHPTRGVNQNAAVHHFAEHGGTSSSTYESKQTRPKARSPVYEVHSYRVGEDIDICGYTAQQASTRGDLIRPLQRQKSVSGVSVFVNYPWRNNGRLFDGLRR